MVPPNTRRWPRYQVKLPVRIITPNDASEIVVPGLTTEISRGGMALYGGVPLQPGDLMEVEFQTSKHLRVAASVRDRNGYCFGLEFLGLLPSEDGENTEQALAGMAGAYALGRGVEIGFNPVAEPVVRGEDEALTLFLKRHEAYLRQKELEIKRWRYEIQEIRQSRREIDVILRQVLGRSG
ncbi:MAG: PilZ domain-containing protein [Terriglobales bacterium]